MVKISGGGIFKNSLRKGRKSDFDGATNNNNNKKKKNPKALPTESLDPTVSEDEDSMASFSLRPCTNSTRGTGTRANISLDASTESFIFIDDDDNDNDNDNADEASSSDKEKVKVKVKETDKTNVRRKMEKMGSTRTYGTVATEDDAENDQQQQHEEEEHDEIQASDHCPAFLKPQSSSNSPKNTPPSSPRSTRSPSKSPRISRIRKLKKMDSEFSVDSPVSSSKPQRKKKRKSKKNKIIADSNESFQVDLPQSFRSSDMAANQRAKTKNTKRKPKKRTSVESMVSKPSGDATVNSLPEVNTKRKLKKRTSVESMMSKPSDDATVNSQPELIKRKRKPKKRTSVESTVSRPSDDATVNSLPELNIKRKQKKRTSKNILSNEASSDSKTHSLSSDHTDTTATATTTTQAEIKSKVTKRTNLESKNMPSDEAPTVSSSETMDATTTSQSEIKGKVKETTTSEPKTMPSDEAPTVSSRDHTDASAIKSEIKSMVSQRSNLESKTMPSDEAPTVDSSERTDAKSQQPATPTESQQPTTPTQSEIKSTLPDPSVSSSDGTESNIQQPIPPPPPPPPLPPTQPESMKFNGHDDTIPLVEAIQPDFHNMLESPSGRRLTLEERRKRKQATLNNLVNKFNDYEFKLEKEKSHSNSSSLRLQFKLETTEQLLKEEIEKNEELKSQVQQVQQQLESASKEGDNHSRELEDLKVKLRKLEKENEFLRQENAAHEETIYDMRLAEREMNRKILHGAKAQGELLLLRSSLKSKTEAVERLSSELANVKREMEELRAEKGVENMQLRVKDLEGVKEILSGEIERLETELHNTILKLQAAIGGSDGSSCNTPGAMATTNGRSRSLSTNNLQEIHDSTNDVPPQGSHTSLEKTVEGANSHAKDGSWFLPKSFRNEDEMSSDRPSLTVAQDQSWWSRSLKGFGESNKPSKRKKKKRLSSLEMDLIDMISKSSHHRSNDY